MIATRIRDTERETYEAMWGVELYGAYSPGEQFIDAFLDMTGAPAHATPRPVVLDAGCGNGKGALALEARGFDVTLCDLTATGLCSEARGLPFVEACLWDDLARAIGYRAEWVYCCDVLEHVPTAFTMLTLRRLLDVSERGVFCSIALAPDACGVWVGKPLHQTVQPFPWWREAFREVGHVVECRDLQMTGLYVVRSRA